MLSHLDTESSRDNHGRVWNTRKNHLAWRVYLRGTAKRDVSPYASPALQTDFRNLPPCYTFVGQGEPFCAETLQYTARLRAAGVEAEADVYPSDLHAFDMLDPDSPVSREAVRKLHTRMETVLSDLLKKDEEENDAKTDHF
jgi:acetyl esterase/lipase